MPVGGRYKNTKYGHVELIARERGWDCFKENTND